MRLEAIPKRIVKQFEFSSRLDFGIDIDLINKEWNIEAWWQQQSKTKTTLGWYLSVHFFFKFDIT